MKTNFRHAVPLYTLSFILAFSLCLPTAGLAYASPDDESVSGSHSHEADTAQTSSPCIPSDEDIAKWEADGTLDDRIAFQESLGNGEVSSSLIAQAQQRANGSRMLRSSSGNLPSDVSDDLSMSTTEKAEVLALYVTFKPEADGTTHEFKSGDTPEALQALIGSPLPSSNPENSPQPDYTNSAFVPYDSLNAYYKRSSYGELDISGKVFEYEAENPRSHYDNNISKLFIEALAKLDNEIDYTDYDADGDDYIDAIYIHFAGDHSGWGSTWWSNCSFFQDDEDNPMSFDDKKIGCTISLHLPSNTEEGIRTAIHETGHALGLPDYYAYEPYRVKTDPSNRTGILTFDMMNNNIGDHNAYSKWLLGWIDDSKITHIVANNSGFKVKVGTNNAEAIAPDENNEYSYTSTLELLAGDDPAKCGGFIAISSNDSLLDQDGLLSSFYLLEYNGPKGNQAVDCYESDNGYNAVAREIPYGFRLFRVQAEVDPGTGNFIHKNQSDGVHNQFIELVDHDAAAWHNEYIGMAGGTGIGAYGCMMTAGDSISPKGSTDSNGTFADYPSTNFFENIYTGFTGLSIQITQNGENSGAALISYSNRLKPNITSDMLTLSQVSPRGIDSTDVITLQGSMPLARAGFTETPYLLIGDTRHDIYVDDPSGQTISFSYSISAEDFPANTECEVVFPAGFFSLGMLDGTEILSDEVRVPLTTNDVLVADATGLYADTSSDRALKSNPITSSAGETYFATSNQGKIALHTVNANDPTQTNHTVIPGIDKPNVSKLHLEALANGELCLITNTYVGDLGYENAAYWIDPATAGVTKTSYLPYLNPGTSFSTISTVGSGLVVTWSEVWDHELPSYINMEAHVPTVDGYVSIHSWMVDAVGTTHEVSNVDGKLAFTGNTFPTTSSITKIIDIKKFIIDNMRVGYLSFDDLVAETTFDSSAYSGVASFAYLDGKYLTFAYDLPAGAGSPDLSTQSTQPSETDEAPAWRDSTDMKAYLVSFDESGAETSSYLFGTYPPGRVSFEAIAISPLGVPALEISLDPDRNAYRRVLFFKNGIESKPITYTSETIASGTWLHNDAWLDTYFFYTGGYEDMTASVRYLISFLPGDTNDGEGSSGEGDTGSDPKPNPAPGTPSDGAGSVSDNTLSNTGDATGLMAIGCTVAAIAAIVVAILAFRASRKNR